MQQLENRQYRERRMPTIHLDFSGDYTADLKVRLEEYGISHGELSRESGISPSQLSRWFNTDVQPRVENIVKIETAVARIRKRRKRQERKNRST